MRVAYVAGPYRSPLGPAGIKANIEAAWKVARQLWAEGYAVICPHANTALMDGSDIGDAKFLDGDLELLARCDVVFPIPGWKSSKGAKAEIQFAIRNEIDVDFRFCGEEANG